MNAATPMNAGKRIIDSNDHVRSCDDQWLRTGPPSARRNPPTAAPSATSIAALIVDETCRARQLWSRSTTALSTHAAYRHGLSPDAMGASSCDVPTPITAYATAATRTR